MQTENPAQAWRETEQQLGKPLVLVLDQMEELLFAENKQDKESRPAISPLDRLFQTLHSIFYASQERPQGKIIISLRKEWFTEFYEACRHHRIRPLDYLLKPLDKAMIMEIIEGISSTQALRQKYQISIATHHDTRLAEFIADDLLVSEHASIAPTLQIILSKLWDSVKLSSEQRLFNKARYEALRKQGIFLEDYLQLCAFSGKPPTRYSPKEDSIDSIYS